jgi:hypothetical protein
VAIDLARERDPDMLRRIARLLEAENAWLHQRLAQLTRALAEARGEAQTQLELELRQLQEQLAARTQQLYGRSSERRGRGTDTAAAAAGRTPAAQRGHGPRTQPSLPLVEVTHTLDAADETCPKCGGHLEAWTGQTEDAEEIDIVERQFVLKRHRRQKYRCGCGECIDTALGKALAYTTELWPGLVAFLDHAAIPLDNNGTERALRGVAVGRKNHYGSRSERGTQVAALCYSLLESAKLVGIDPATYLAEATRRAIATPGTVTLPHALRS